MRLVGKKKNIIENVIGMNFIIFVWIGFGGVGFRFVCMNIDMVISIGRMKNGLCCDRL